MGPSVNETGTGDRVYTSQSILGRHTNSLEESWILLFHSVWVHFGFLGANFSHPEVLAVDINPAFLFGNPLIRKLARQRLVSSIQSLERAINSITS